MKQKLSIVFILVILAQMLSLQAFAAGTSIKTDFSEEENTSYYDDALQETMEVLDSTDNVYVKNAGLEVYPNGWVRQSVIVQPLQQARTNYISGNVFDYWYRLGNTNEPVCRVYINCQFTYDGTNVAPVRDEYYFGYYIYSDYRNSVTVTERSVQFTNGVGLAKARVDTDYSVMLLTLMDIETISISCDRNGNLKRYGQNEAI